MGTTIIFQFFTIFLQNFYLYFYPKVANLGLMKLDIIAYTLRKIYELSLCKIVCKNNNIYGFYKYIPISHDFCT